MSIEQIAGGPAWPTVKKAIGLGKPKMPDIPPVEPQVEPREEIEIVEEEAEVARRRQRKKLLTTGRRATILSGITTALKKRLGE